MTKGYVAFLDVLGFSAMVQNEQSGQIDQYFDALKAVLEATPDGGPTTKTVSLIFSDSIVLLPETEGEEGLRLLIRSCSYLMGELLRAGIAMRGAISYGTYVSRTLTSGRFVAGKAIVDAYRCEEQQDWVGIMLAPSVLEQFPGLPGKCGLPSVPRTNNRDQWLAWVRSYEEKARWAVYVQPCQAIPFHTEPTDYAGYAIVPTQGDSRLRSATTSLQESIAAIGRLKMLAPDPLAQRKYQRATNWLAELSARREMSLQIAENVAAGNSDISGLIKAMVG